MIILDRAILDTVLAGDPEAVSWGVPMWSCFDSHQGVRPLYETMDEFRTGTGYHPHEDLLESKAPFVFTNTVTGGQLGRAFGKH